MTALVDGAAGRLALLWGWRRLVASILAGAASSLAMAPYDLVPVLFLTFPALVWLLDGTVDGPGAGRRNLLAAAVTGWGFGFGYFLGGLWWIGRAFLVEADVFAWMIPFAIVLLPAGLALFTAVGTALARLFWSPGPARVFALAFGLGVAEYARGHLLTGFPWNGFGQVFAASAVTMQAAALVGAYGLAVVAVIVFAAPAVLSGEGSRAARTAVLATAAMCLVGIAGYGSWRLSLPEPVDTVRPLRLRIVQPSVPQETKWDPAHRSEILAAYLELTDRAASPDAMGAGDADLVVWPESAVPYVFDFETAALPAIAAVLPPGTSLVTGLQRVEQDPERAVGWRVYNSVFLFDDAGRVQGSYDKVKLVPFGEFLPWQETLEAMGLEQLTRVVGGFEAGSSRGLLGSDAVPSFAPLVCYEIIFPGAALPAVGERPGWLLNVTNDAWFGDTPGPRQHLRQARLRAVEEGLPVLRAANTGISAVIDARGRAVATLGLGKRGVIDAVLPAALPPTVYARLGETGFALLLAVCGLVAASARLREPRSV